MALNIESRDVRVERYFPDVLANAKEFKALGAAVDPELKLNWQALIKQMLNTFVYDLDVDGAARWEKMLKLHPLATDSLATRRRRILIKINAALPYTFRSFQNLLDGVYGEGNIVERLKPDLYELWLDLSATLVRRSLNVRYLARVIVPANLVICISNTKNLSLYYRLVTSINVTHRTTINALQDCDLTGDYPAMSYCTAILSEYKHIIIGELRSTRISVAPYKALAISSENHIVIGGM